MIKMIKMTNGKTKKIVMYFYFVLFVKDYFKNKLAHKKRKVVIERNKINKTQLKIKEWLV